MNWAQFKDPVSHMCLAGAVAAFWSLTQEVTGLSPFTVMTNIFVTEFSEFSETFRKNSNVYLYTCSFRLKHISLNYLKKRKLNFRRNVS